ncbi:MAG TPA: MFS transporter [Chloroflexota bacterium]|nr:MFS transporter [Chloroflexota bacterium]
MTERLGAVVSTETPGALESTPVPAAAAPAEPAPRSGLQTFRSLRHRDYRLLWFGTLFSGLGQWIQQATLGWLTYDLTGSAFLLGAVNGCRSLPLLLLGPFGGVAADRVDRRRLMLTTQVGLMLLSTVFATLIILGQLRVWHIFAFTLLTGVSWAFNMPVRQSVVPNIVARGDLMNAMALNAAGFNITRILGPTVAGVLIATLGPGENFYLQAAAYLGVSLMVLQLRIPPAARAAHHSVRANLKEGGLFIWRHPTLRTQMSLALVPVVVALPYTSLMPIFASDVLDVGPTGFGLLMSAPGVGAVIGTLTIASLESIERKGLLMLGAVFGLGASLVAFSLSRSFLLSLALLIVVGAVQMVYMTTNQTLIQLTTPDHLRGRIMGVYMLNQGLLPLGSLLAGTLAGLFGAPLAVSLMGVLVALLALVFAAQSRTLRGM